MCPDRGFLVFSCMFSFGSKPRKSLKFSRYNRMVSRRPATLLLAIVVLASCRNSTQNREQVQAAILHRLQASSGLDLKGLNVTTTSVTFDKNLAYATVAFHPKNDPTITNGMVMKYTLEDRDGKWVVLNVADSQGHGLSGHGNAGASQLPPGHPPVDGARPGQPTPDPQVPSASGGGGPNGHAQ